MKRQGFKKRAHLSREFVFAIRAHPDRLEILKELDIPVGRFNQWATGMNKVGRDDPLIGELAERVGFKGRIFE